MTYFFPSEEQNKLRNKFIIIAWGGQAEDFCESNEAVTPSQWFLRGDHKVLANMRA